MKKDNVTPDFSGPLGEPIQLRETTTLLGDTEAPYRDALAQAEQKLPLLAMRYGVVPDNRGIIDWRTVCFRLANDFVPGFQIIAPPPPPRKRGRRKAGSKNEWQLLFDVARCREGKPPSFSVLAACRWLISQKGSWRGQNANTLKSRHSELLRRFKQTFGYEYGSSAHRLAWEKIRNLPTWDVTKIQEWT